MSFETLEKAIDRQNQRLNPSTFQPAEIHQVDDIRRVLAEIDPKNARPAPEIQLATLLNALEDGKNTTYRVTAATKSKSKRDMLIEGMDLIKRQISAADQIANMLEPTEVNGVLMKPPKFGQNGQGQSWIDPLISHWLGGRREGLLICWDLDGYKYQYDVYTHKLNRVKNERED